MSKKSKKFDLTALVHNEQLTEGQKLVFVSDPSKWCKVAKQPNHEFKVTDSQGVVKTVHQFAMECLGQEPPDHAAKWLRTESGKTLYDLWHADDYAEAA
ncbi:MAG: hypothetical protein AB7P04_12780 [Bacteriovoracia bacterium]